MIDSKDAVKKAKEYLHEIMDLHIPDTKLEEIEIDESGELWLVTLSYFEQDAHSVSFARKYKVLGINRETGEVVSMKIKVFK